MSNELLPCPFCGGEAETDDIHGLIVVECVLCRATLRKFVSSDAAASAWNRRATPPAPVTEGAQREAVALLEAAKEVARKVSCRTDKERDAMTRLDEAIAAYRATPPPDRVQPERVEAEPNPVEPEAIARWIEAGCFDADRMSVRRHMAALVRALVLPSPPTDASGGVTEGMIGAAMLAFYQEDSDGSSPDMRRAIEAADRARKPGYRQPALSDAVELCCYLQDRHLYLTARDGTDVLDALRAFNYAIPEGTGSLGAVIPEAGHGGQQAQPE